MPSADAGTVLTRDPLLAEGGLETTLIFHEGIDLPDFASFVLLGSSEGQAALRRYYRRYIDVARTLDVAVMLDTPTWRASADWGARLGYSNADLAEANSDAVALLRSLRVENEDVSILVCGTIGPRGDGYDPAELMRPDAAEAYHQDQVTSLAAAGVDLACALTMTHTGEAIGVVRAAVRHELPVVVSFTVETDGRLPTGQPLGDAIREVDAETGSAPVFFMINCAHPTHFRDALAAAEGDAWLERIAGVRANASKMSHAELDEAEELDDGDPVELAEQYGELATLLPNLRVVGGCCGTDDRHIGAVGRAVHGTG